MSLHSHALETSIVVTLVGLFTGVLVAMYPLTVVVAGPFMVYVLSRVIIGEAAAHLEEEPAAALDPVDDLSAEAQP